MSYRILVAGTTGGVGTTTTAALLAAGLAEHTGHLPTLIDHSGGELATRLPNDAAQRPVDPNLILHDAGTDAVQALVQARSDVTVLTLLVTAGTAAGRESAAAILHAAVTAPITTTSGVFAPPENHASILIVPVEAFGRHNTEPLLRKLQTPPQARLSSILGYDPALAAGGIIPDNILSPTTRQTQSVLASTALSQLGLSRTRR